TGGDEPGIVDSSTSDDKPFTVAFSEVAKERDAVESLFKALIEAKKQAGQDTSKSGNLESFASFVKNKTAQIRQEYGCEAVEYSVEMQDCEVRWRAVWHHYPEVPSSCDIYHSGNILRGVTSFCFQVSLPGSINNEVCHGTGSACDLERH